MTDRKPLRRVLIIKMWALGDLLMATPMLAALRARDPDVKITWVVEAAHAELLANHPLIDELIAVDSAAWRRKLKRGNVIGWLAQAWTLKRQMRQRMFDAVINCQPDKDWARLLCAAPIRIGLYPTETLPADSRFYTKAIARPKHPSVHNTDHYLMATRALGCPDADKRMTIGETPDEAVFLRAFEENHNLRPDAPLVILAPFSNGANRCWEPERYSELADWLYDHYRARMVMTIGPGDAESARDMADSAAQAKMIVAQGTTIRQYVGLLRRADLVISGDSSPMHIAAAVGTPFIALFGPTPPAERVPLVGHGMAIAKPLFCAPCDLPTCANPVFRQCMKLIEVSDVKAAAASYLKIPAAAR